MVNNFTRDDVRYIIYKVIVNKGLYPSHTEIYKLNFFNLYECYLFIKSLDTHNIDIFLNAINNDNFVVLTDFEYKFSL